MRIAPHHARDEWRPRREWPEDCYVQWGGHGIVLSSDPARPSYGTAFFEAFPGKGFIRGEGVDLEAAEDHAFERHLAEASCDHLWGRGKYLNGGTVCRRCRAFKVGMKPVVVLGDWKRRGDLSDVHHAMDGMCCPVEGDDPRQARWRREMWLRVRVAGVDLPEPVARKDLLHVDPTWRAAAVSAVREWLKARGGVPTEGTSGSGILSGLDDIFARRAMERILAGGEG